MQIERELTSELESERGKLISLLQKHGIPLELWGKESAKTIDDLLAEIRSSESVIKATEREIVRETKAVEIHIRYTSPSGEIYLLSEEKQTFRDGRERRRNYPWSVSGKIKAHETSEQAFKRELDEELPSIRGNFKSMVEHPEPKIVIRKSNSYPGLISHFTVFVFEVELTNEQFQTSGYISVEPELTNHFVWKKINETNPNK